MQRIPDELFTEFVNRYMGKNWKADEDWLKGYAERTGRGEKSAAQSLLQGNNEPAKLIRQATRDKRNALEKAFEAEVLYWRKLRQEIADYKPHGLRLQLANGVTYTPDYYVAGHIANFPVRWKRVEFYEIKGEKRQGRVVARDDAIVKIKVAAKEYPEFYFYLAWKDNSGNWCYQQVGEVETE